MNKIIVFGNQKGGVGKTTLCTQFANYLAGLHLPVFVIDCDSQRTIYDKRQVDIRSHGEDAFGYKIQPFNIADEEKVQVLMKNLRQINGIILIDSPGHLAQQGLIPLFAGADYVVCPYQYEATSINSTAKFIAFLGKLNAYKTKKSNIFFVPNMYDSRVGRAAELELWKQTEKTLEEYGMNAPKVKFRKELQRYNTIAISKTVKDDLFPAFDFIYSKIHMD